MDKPDDDTLNGILDEIASAGNEGDSVTQSLAKGMGDALGQLIDLVKVSVLAKGEVPDEDEEEEEGEGDGEGGEGEGDEGDASGYEDLAMGAVAEGYVDVTKLFADVQAGIKRLQGDRAHSNRQFKALAKAVVDLKAANTAMRDLLAKSIAANAVMQGQPAKGVIGLREDVSLIPEATVTPRARLKAPVAPAAETEGEFIGGSEVRQRQLLAKGLHDSILNPSQRRMYHLNGVFSDVKPEHDRITKALTDLATA